jgi:hypothetical protein
MNLTLTPHIYKPDSILDMGFCLGLESINRDGSYKRARLQTWGIFGGGPFIMPASVNRFCEAVFLTVFVNPFCEAVFVTVLVNKK